MTKKEKIQSLLDSYGLCDERGVIADKNLALEDDKLTELEIEDIIEGTGREVKDGDIIQIHYSGKLVNGKEFDSSYKRGVPFEVAIGVGRVIRGWDLGIIGLKVGGKRRLSIPAQLGYGNLNVGNGMIPAGSDLYFDVELIGIN